MRVRFTVSLGMTVVEEDSVDPVGVLSGILIHPDTGAIEGFFVRAAGFFGSTTFLPSIDILHWGVRIMIRDRSVLCVPEDIIRLQPILSAFRPVIGQRIETESGRVLGRCADIQFSTKDFRMEWIFPKKFFRWCDGIPASKIVEVTADAIVVKDLAVPKKIEEEEQTEVPILPQIEAA